MGLEYGYVLMGIEYGYMLMVNGYVLMLARYSWRQCLHKRLSHEIIAAVGVIMAITMKHQLLNQSAILF